MTEFFLYKFLDLPRMPQELIDIALQNIDEKNIIKNKQNIDYEVYSNEKLISEDGNEKRNVAFVHYDLDERVLNWITENVISEGYTDLKITKNTPGDSKFPHTDRTRDYVLLYMVECGGEKPYTIFYKEKDKELLRVNDLRFTSYDLVEEVDRVFIPQHHWCILNSRVIHGVEGITGFRISFHLGSNDYTKFKGQ
jgi:hypothetical protein